MPSSCWFSHRYFFTHPSRQAQGLMGRLSGCQGPGRMMRLRWELRPGPAQLSSSNCWELASPEDKLVTADLAERPVPLGVGFFRCNRNNLIPSSKAGPASPGHPHHRSWPWETLTQLGPPGSMVLSLHHQLALPLVVTSGRPQPSPGLWAGVRAWLPALAYPARASCSLPLCLWPPRE